MSDFSHKQLLLVSQKISQLTHRLHDSDSCSFLEQILIDNKNLKNSFEVTTKIKCLVASDSLRLTQKFLNLVCRHTQLNSSCDFQEISLNPIHNIFSSKTKDISSTCLIFQDRQSLNNSCQSKPLNKKIVIGRDLHKLQQKAKNDNSDTLDFPDYRKVSSVHAEISIQPCSDSYVWKIIDLDSKNSTYVNGEKLVPHLSRDLHDGDKIILGSPYSSEKYPELTFRKYHEASIHKGIQPDDLSNYRLFVLVIDPTKSFDKISLDFIERISKLERSCIIILGDLAEVDELERPKSKRNIAKTQDGIQKRYPKLSIKSILLDLSPFLSGSKDADIKPLQKRSYHDFYKILEDCSKSYTQYYREINIRNVLNNLIDRLEEYIHNKKEIIRNKLIKIDEKLDNKKIEEWSWIKQSFFREINDEREVFNEKVRREIDKSFSEIISNNRSGSLPRKLRNFIDHFKILTSEEGNQVQVQLQTEHNHSVHDEILKFCKAELKNWAEQEWRKLLYEYAEGGFNGLLHRTYSNCYMPPATTVDPFFDQVIEMPNFQKSLDISFLELEECDHSYEKISSNNNYLQLGVEGAMAAGTAFFNPVMAVLQGVRLTSSLIGRSFDTSQIAREDAQLQNVSNTLRQRTNSYYQSLSRSVAEELKRDIIDALVSLNRQFRKALTNTDEQAIFYFRELQKSTDYYTKTLDYIEREERFLVEVKSILM